MMDYVCLNLLFPLSVHVRLEFSEILSQTIFII